MHWLVSYLRKMTQESGRKLKEIQSIWMYTPRSLHPWKHVYTAKKVGMKSQVISHCWLNIKIITMLLDLHWPVGSLRKMSQEEDQVEEEIERDWKCMDARTPISSPMKTCLHSEKSRDEFTSVFTWLIKHQNHQYVAWFALTRRFFKED